MTLVGYRGHSGAVAGGRWSSLPGKLHTGRIGIASVLAILVTSIVWE